MTIMTKQMREQANEETIENISMDNFKEKKFEILYKMLLEDFKDATEQKEAAYMRLNNMSKMFNILHGMASEKIEDLDTKLQAEITKQIGELL